MIWLGVLAGTGRVGGKESQAPSRDENPVTSNTKTEVYRHDSIILTATGNN